ncbi:myb/SANT-like DNA-binding domain-containing protein 2 isoform X1 [Sinocyclocheilus anshuiensis]|uniref:myb/SANT-like DNA-binding domain-containing protein 2 isoform X1 n=2 Tax=Sinocyclocheilus anshuiensis TaxID=1608454 RepID=UPI0007B9B35C|nr:PREDICTED: myb/SANT-like DNA-binding domain-containing protein 2 isoform X1 [Sinocyclocheilus anshuiensis]XP_016338453.1 PREDICTED: myb/SANT-like DNA-binding domain-containing protein 2 isoform X1 [Sinocyclocheilus anshuiensis]
MAAPSNAERSPDLSVPLKIPKTEVPSPESEDLSDSNQYHSNPSTPNRFSPLNVGVSLSGGAGRSGSASASNSFTACRGMSWTPSETNALIAVWGNERLAEARMQQLEVAGTVFSGKAPGPAMYERVSRALSELGYERTPSQCRERMKTLRRCYSRVKEHGIGKRKSSYSFEQLEKVFGQGGWDSQSCQPVLINSSGLYQEMESDGSTMEDYSQEDWCNQDLSAAFNEGDIETDDNQLSKTRVLQIRLEPSEHAQRQEVMQNVMRILESVEVKWEHFQTWTDFSRLHLSNKLAIFGVGYNTRWREEIRYHYAEISSQVPLGKRLREYFNPEKAEGRVIMTKVQKMNWKNVYYKFLDITISEARCLELHMEVDWIPIAQTRAAGCSNGSQYLLPGGIPKTYGLYAIGYEETGGSNSSSSTEDKSSPSQEEEETDHCESVEKDKRTSAKVTYSYLGIAEERTLQQCLFQHFQTSGKHYSRGEPSAVTRFLQDNCTGQAKEGVLSGLHIYIKFIEVELDFLSAGSLLECLETAIGYSLRFNKKDAL